MRLIECIVPHHTAQFLDGFGGFAAPNPTAIAPSLGLRPKPQFLVRFGSFAAKTNQKNVVGRLRLPTPHRRRRTLHKRWCNGCLLFQ
jgi:hypothetical protein